MASLLPQCIFRSPNRMQQHSERRTFVACRSSRVESQPFCLCSTRVRSRVLDIDNDDTDDDNISRKPFSAAFSDNNRSMAKGGSIEYNIIQSVTASNARFVSIVVGQQPFCEIEGCNNSIGMASMRTINLQTARASLFGCSWQTNTPKRSDTHEHIFTE